MNIQNYPRSPKALLGGIAHLGRFIDKIRLRHEGKIQGRKGFQEPLICPLVPLETTLRFVSISQRRKGCCVTAEFWEKCRIVSGVIITEQRIIMTEFVKPDPEQLVIVCISGYQLSITLLKDKRFLQEITQHAQLVGVDPEDIKRQLEKDWKRKGADPIGMQKLRDRLARDLVSSGVRDESVLYRKWSTNSNDGMGNEPDYGDLAEEINRLSPQHLVLLGHSYGAWAACRLSRATNIRSTYIGLLDPMFSYQWSGMSLKSGEQSAHEDNYPVGGSIRSWWQDGGQPYGAREVRQAIDSRRPLVGNHKVRDTKHTDIDDSVLLHGAISEAMIQLLDGTTDWPDDGMMK